MKIFQILKSFIFLILSLTTILKCFFKNKKKAQLVILKEKSVNLIDTRLKIYQNTNDYNKDFVNFVRGQNFYGGLKIYFKINNVIFFNHIFNILEYYQSIKGIKQRDIKKNFVNLLSKIIRILKIEKFYSIDDYRNIEIFSKACKLNKTKLFIYQHGRISINLKYQNSLKNLIFEKYFVWNKYFKEKLLVFNKNYDREKIIIFNKFKSIKKISLSEHNQNNILIVQEDFIKNKSIIEIVKRLRRFKNNKIYFKFRPNNPIDLELKNYLIKNEITYFHHKDIYKIFKNFKINFILASNSSLLLEASYFLINPILFYEKKPLLEDYVSDRVVFPSKIKSINKVMSIISKQNKDKIVKIKKKVWGI